MDTNAARSAARSLAVVGVEPQPTGIGHDLAVAVLSTTPTGITATGTPDARSRARRSWIWSGKSLEALSLTRITAERPDAGDGPTQRGPDVRGGWRAGEGGRDRAEFRRDPGPRARRIADPDHLDRERVQRCGGDKAGRQVRLEGGPLFRPGPVVRHAPAGVVDDEDSDVRRSPIADEGDSLRDAILGDLEGRRRETVHRLAARVESADLQVHRRERMGVCRARDGRDVRGGRPGRGFGQDRSERTDDRTKAVRRLLQEPTGQADGRSTHEAGGGRARLQIERLQAEERLADGDAPPVLLEDRRPGPRNPERQAEVSRGELVCWAIRHAGLRGGPPGRWSHRQAGSRPRPR